jgi:Tfp pilus assembly PilM family ATPase
MYLKKILTYCPPPTFLEMPAVGLDVTDEAIYLVELKRSNGSFTLGKYGEKILPKGMIDGGRINDVEGLTEILKDLKNEYGLEYIRASLPEEKTFLFRTEIPYTEDNKQIKSSLEFKLEENVPIPPSEAIFEFDVIDPPHERADHLDVSVSAVPEKVISTYAKVLRAAGLTPVSFEVETRAIAKSVVRKGDLGTILIVDVGATKTGVYIVSGGVLRFSSTLSVDVSVEALSDDRETMGLLAVVAEIARIHLYWNTHNDKSKEVNPRIEKIVLCGQIAQTIKLDQYVARKLQIPVELANVWCNVNSFENYIPAVGFSKSLDYAVAVGLVLSQYHDF